ncbi:hypothetical protein IOZ78_002539 [Salmonella enterica]|nr:hypothetical protein [Salmonella enterica]
MVKALDVTPDALYSDRFEEDAGAQLQDTLSEFGFTSEQAIRLCGLVRGAQMDEAELARRAKR